MLIRYRAVNWLISCLLTCDNTARTLLARTTDVDSQRKNRQLLGHEFIEHTCPPASRVARYWHEALRRGDNDEDGIIIISCWCGTVWHRTAPRNRNIVGWVLFLWVSLLHTGAPGAAAAAGGDFRYLPGWTSPILDTARETVSGGCV